LLKDISTRSKPELGLADAATFHCLNPMEKNADRCSKALV